MPKKIKVQKKTVSKKADQNIYDGRQMIPADNVDADGKAWPTVGENIRKGTKDINEKLAEKMYAEILGFDVEIVDVTLDLSKTNITTTDPRVIGGNNAVFIDNPFVLITAYSERIGDLSPSNIFLVFGIPRKVYIQIRQQSTLSNIPLHLILVLKK